MEITTGNDRIRVAGRQVEPSGNRFALESDGYRFDFVVGQPRVIGETFALLGMKLYVFLAGIIVRPFGGAIVNGRHVPIVTRRHRITLRLGSAGLSLPPRGGAFKDWTDVSHLLYPGANGSEVGSRFDATWCRKIDRSWLVPIDAVRVNDVIEGPALFFESLCHCRTIIGKRRAAWTCHAGSDSCYS